MTKVELTKLQKQLITDNAIGEKLGVTRQRVNQLRKKFDIPAIMNKNKVRNEKIISLRKKGLAIKEIAEKLSLSIYNVYFILRNSK